MDVGLHKLAAVHERVSLDRLDQLAHPVCGLCDLRRQPTRGQGRGDPLDRGAGSGSGNALKSPEPCGVDAGRGERFGQAPRLGRLHLLEGLQ